MKPKLLTLMLCGVSGALLINACASNTVVSPNVENARMAVAENPSAKGMVSSANPHATDAGIAILRAGGTAVDAAIAVQTTLSLVEPQSSGIGGGSFMVFYDAQSGEVTAYNGREKAPASIDATLFLDENGDPIRRFAGIASGISTGAPGAISMLKMAHEDHGALAWADSFTPAIKLAEDGFAVSPRMAGLVARFGEYALKKNKASRDYYFHADGTPIEVGFIRDNQPYADTLKAIAQDYRALYEGPIAEAIVATVREEPLPGTLSLEDLKNYKPTKSKALCSTYRTYMVCGAQPPASGGVAVQSILGQLENFDMSTLGPTLQGWHVFAEASELAYADRDLFVADPEFVDVPVTQLLDKSYLKSRADLIKMDSTMKNVQAGDPVGFKPGKDATPDNPGTSHFSIVDKWGNVVSMTTTVEAPFGSERMTNGFMLNNQLTDFSFRVKDADGKLIANRPQAGKRPRSSMSPHIVFDAHGQFDFATGSPGGNSIIAYTAKTLVAMIDWGMSPQEAADLANVISRNGSVRLEENNLAPEIIEGLELLGHKVVRSKGEISGIHIIKRNADGSYEGAADIRREGTAVSE
ncbi:MAG: gamma-glutamyltransferase [Acidimicrobiales bacterium]|nr:MAG: gamma-glutamyltransferase [Acidimicrobiales bacterium]